MSRSDSGDATTGPVQRPEASPAPKDAAFPAGLVIANRYRIVSLLGRGGMGEVYRADDLTLGSIVALKFLPRHVAYNPASAQALRDEVRLARRVSHPNVCRVHDIGAAENGRPFLAMEYMDGEDLSRLLQRIGKLPREKAFDIGRQVCSSLHAVHEQGLVHRDLKPANVMLDGRGRVRLTDFGIAAARDRKDSLAGTPGYMAPELFAGGRPSEASDVYALALVIGELLTGRRLTPAANAAGRPAGPRIDLAPPFGVAFAGLDEETQRVLRLCLSPNPRDRPSVQSVAAALSSGEPPPAATAGPASWRQPSKRLLVVAGLAAAAALAAIIALSPSPFMMGDTSPLTQQDVVVLAEFENQTGDPIFDGALKVALAVALEQSPFLRIYPEGRARETLRLMQRSSDLPVTRAIAQEIARREQLKALLAGSIAPLGRNYVVALEAVNAESGDVIAREQAEAVGKEQVLTALGAAASRLRKKLGESLASVQKFDASLPRATTASLDALHAYALALVQGREIPRLEAIPHLRRAIEIDPSFAMAHAQLSLMYTNTGQPDLAPAFSRKAFELRDTVSERERFFISWRYFVDAEQNWERALELAQSWTASYPREASAFNSLGNAFMSLGQFEPALSPYREAMRLDPSYVPAYSNLAAALMSLGRTAEGQATLQQAAHKRLDFNGTRRMTYLIAFVMGDDETMTRALESSVGVQATNAAFGWQGHGSAFHGRVTTAHQQFRRGIQMSQQGGFHEVTALLTLEDAEIHATVGQCDDARREAQAGLELSRGNVVLIHASRIFALCGPIGTASSLSNELVRRFPTSTLVLRVHKPIVDAAVAIQRGEPAQALELLDAVKPYDVAPFAELWPPYLRGRAHLQLRDGRAAAGQFRSVLNNRGVAPQSQLHALAYLELARAEALQGRNDAARKAYEAMLSIWKDADPMLQPLKAARTELAGLR